MTLSAWRGTRPFGQSDVAVGAMISFPKTLDDRSTLADAVALFSDDHVHMALLVTDDGRLLTTIERSDLRGDVSTPLSSLGTLEGRTVPPDAPLSELRMAMLNAGRRRLAVVDDGRLLGLLCLKRSGDGFCSDQGVARRAAERASTSC